PQLAIGSLPRTQERRRQVAVRDPAAAGILEQQHIVEPSAFVQPVRPQHGSDIVNLIQRGVGHQHAGSVQGRRETVAGKEQPQPVARLQTDPVGVVLPGGTVDAAEEGPELLLRRARIGDAAGLGKIRAQDLLCVFLRDVAAFRIDDPVIESGRAVLRARQRANPRIDVDPYDEGAIGERHRRQGYCLRMNFLSVSDRLSFKPAELPSWVQLLGIGYIMMELQSSLVPAISFCGYSSNMLSSIVAASQSLGGPD